MKRIEKRNMMIAAAAITAVILVMILAVEGISELTRTKADTEEGLAIIKAAESKDVAAVETKIQTLESTVQFDGTGADSRSLKEIFSSVVIMGGSVAQGFAEYDVLNASSVTAEIGAALTDIDGQIEKAKEINPQYIFLNYGLNDVTAVKGDEKEFIKQYKEAIKTVREELPNTGIFVNAIFPVTENAAEKETDYAKIELFNQELKKLCDEQQIAFIDSTALVEESDYETDGVHLKASFYEKWAAHMAEVTSL